MRGSLRRSIALTCFAGGLCSCVLLRAQSPAGPEFEVSTVKPSGPDSGTSSGIDTEHGRLDAQNVTLKRCIIGAYEIGPHQVVGGPDWVDTERFDIQAKADQPVNDDSVLDTMLQGLLAERFKLAMHRETRTIPAYVLEVDKSGPKMATAKGGISSNDTNTGTNGHVRLTAKNADMDLLSRVLARELDLPVVNQTGLKGIYDFKLHWTNAMNATAAPGPDDVSIFTAVQEQLGLRLRKTKAPIEVYVIDHAEQPDAN